MATNLNLDPDLLEGARVAGGFRTKKETVEAALRDFLRRHERRRVLNKFGTFEFARDYDYKRARATR